MCVAFRQLIRDKPSRMMPCTSSYPPCVCLTINNYTSIICLCERSLEFQTGGAWKRCRGALPGAFLSVIIQDTIIEQKRPGGCLWITLLDIKKIFWLK